MLFLKSSPTNTDRVNQFSDMSLGTCEPVEFLSGNKFGLDSWSPMWSLLNGVGILQVFYFVFKSKVYSAL